MKRLLFVAGMALMLTACGGSNVEETVCIATDDSVVTIQTEDDMVVSANFRTETDVSGQTEGMIEFLIGNAQREVAALGDAVTLEYDVVDDWLIYTFVINMEEIGELDLDAFKARFGLLDATCN